jgi:pimeloyl-ACP methyl ester carboxylesterase
MYDNIAVVATAPEVCMGRTVSTLRPFQRVPFAELPDAPRRAHGWAKTDERAITLESRAFGRMVCHARVFGSGPPLLLVHGLMTTSYSWRYVLDALGAHYTLYMPDLPGAGRSDKPDVSFAPQALATFLAEFCESQGIVGCDAVGNSMGGYLCMHAAIVRPDLFRRLVNIHSPGIPHLRYQALAAALNVPGSEALLRWLVQRDAHRWVWRNVHYFDETLKSREELAEYAAPLMTREGVRSFARFMSQALGNGDMRAFADKLRAMRDAGQAFPVPLLLLYAERDPLVPPSNGPAFQALIPSATLRWLRDTSHFAHVDTPEPVARELLSFFSKVG